MEYKVEASSTKVRLFLEELMPKFIEQLGLESSRRAVLVKVTKDTQEGMEGSTQYFEFADCYLVCLRSKTRLTRASLLETAVTLAHEMVHVKQLAKGKLKFLPRGQRVWCGKKYSKSTPYLSQPWEVDAYQQQELLLRRAL